MRVLTFLCGLLAASLVHGQGAAYLVTSTWGSGYQATITITNGASPLTAWSFEFDHPDPITSLWDGVHTDLGGGRHRVTNVAWNGNLAPGATVSFGLVAAGDGTAVPTAACFEGVPTPMNGVPSTSTCPGTPPPPPPSAPVPAAPNRSGKRIVGYFAAWGVYQRNYHVADIPGEAITHVNYAFANLDASGNVLLGDPYADVQRLYPGDDPSAPLHGSFNQLLLLKERFPHVKTLISIGGWTWSGHFSTVAATPAGRAAFADSAVSFMTTYGFDGIDIDWEYPVAGGLASNATSPADGANYVLLVQEVRARLDAREALDGRDYLLTVAAPAGPATRADFPIAALHPHLDWLNLMAYDFHGAWSSHTNFNAPLRAVPQDPSASAGLNVEDAVQAYLAAGVPPGKLHLGLPFYGRGFSGVPAANDGLFQPFTGIPMGTWEPGVFDYEDLVANYLPTFNQHRHPVAQVPWLHDPQSGLMISYDDPLSLEAKLDHALALGLGGAMFWEFSGDDAQAALARAVAGRLLDPAPWLQAGTSGSGTGDLTLRIYGLPAAASHVLLLASSTPAPAGPGSGPFLGLTADPLTLAFLDTPATPGGLLHFPSGASPFTAGPLRLPPGSLVALAGSTWECTAVAYRLAPPGLIGASGIATLDW